MGYITETKYYNNLILNKGNINFNGNLVIYGDLIIKDDARVVIIKGDLIVHGNLLIYGRNLCLRLNGDLYIKTLFECINCNIFIKGSLYTQCLYTECEIQIKNNVRALIIYASYNKNRMHVDGDLESLLIFKDEFWRISAEGEIKSYINIESEKELKNLSKEKSKKLLEIIKKESLYNPLNESKDFDLYYLINCIRENKNYLQPKVKKIFNLK